jgi:periplasmic divalent cation tolerance protein
MPDMHRGLPAEGNNIRKGEINGKKLAKPTSKGAYMTYVIVYATSKDEKEARTIGEILVKEKLIACANIIPAIQSIYWWKGKIEKNGEAAMFLKTKKSLVKRLIKRIKELHSYEVPTIDVITISDGNPECFKWIEDVTK